VLNPKRGPPTIADVIDDPSGSDDPIAQLVGARIREARIDRGLTLLELAERAHVPVNSLTSVELGSRRIDAEQLWDVSRCLGRQISFFFSDDPEPAAVEPSRH
jgi:transcriptional regulator with XRE-family HTH domain